MKIFRIATLTASAWLALASNQSFALNLECFELGSYTNRTFFMNRDGGIGFNGTYLRLKSPNGYWGSPLGPWQSQRLDALTGRTQDEGFMLTELEIPISPKSACSNPDADLGVDFRCEQKNIQITATGEGNGVASSPVFLETITKQVYLRGDVQVSFSNWLGTPDDKAYLLTGTLTEPISGQVFTFNIPIRSANRACKVTGGKVSGGG